MEHIEVPTTDDLEVAFQSVTAEQLKAQLEISKIIQALATAIVDLQVRVQQLEAANKPPA